MAKLKPENKAKEKDLTVFKYVLKGEVTKIMLPVGSELLNCHEQHGNITVWVEQERIAGPLKFVEVELHVIPTAGKVPENSLYVGTCFVKDLVWHVYLVE